MHDSHMGSQHPLRILVADDDGSSLMILTAILRRLEYQADVAESGTEALAAMQKSAYDVALVHVEVAGRDGLQACSCEGRC
jgi:CheY-like chemotaxis protein